MRMNPSPLRYPGGKYKLYQYISRVIELNSLSLYAEPFCGGAAVAISLLLNGKVSDVYINDFDYSIYCFWNAIVNHTDDFIKKVEEINVNIDEWRNQKYINENYQKFNDLEVGLSTFFLNRTNRSGIISGAGPIGGAKQLGEYRIDCRFNKKNLINQIKKIGEYRQFIHITNLEACDFIEKYLRGRSDIFTFFDPPYYKRGPKLYSNFYHHEDHLKLSQNILTNLMRSKWIITYDNDDNIKEFYKDIDVIEYNLKYSLQRKYTASELMFFSRDLLRPCLEEGFINMVKGV